jgi:hypothetical protein
MYGEGYDFPPHFAYCLKDLVGALPVGMDCMSGDDPHWSATNTATYKEIWVEPVNRFMGALSIYLSDVLELSRDKNNQDEAIINIKTSLEDDRSAKVIVTLETNQNMEVFIRTDNLLTEIEGQLISLNHEDDGGIQLEMQVEEADKPYVIVVMDAGNPDHRWEATGALVDMDF